ncbi:hypothetical protein LPW11_11695 [Geomonas sp. RF6]|uniref:hypothetical protein n=1 Tax=Geomonas sp. RF6 TaxID=2897342 RepID=UPI001E484DF5|nr:hypothetical protein [Geomonas sp. RF6]UFS68580.1 hypothetical protein LPW11_11695 [Geomonas sp. RF6]
MSLVTVLILAMTFIMTVVMAPRIYWAWLTAEILFAEGEARALRLLQRQQNEWAALHLGCGILVVLMIWVVKQMAPDAPESVCAVLALYAGTSFFYAVLESMLALKVEKLSATIPMAAKAEGG